MGKIVAVCVSEKKGIQKRNIGKCKAIKHYGLEGDAHAGKWHRQVSLLAMESADVMRNKGLEIKDGDFGENIVTSGIELKSLPVGTTLKIGNAIIIKITQIRVAHAASRDFHQHLTRLQCRDRYLRFFKFAWNDFSRFLVARGRLNHLPGSYFIRYCCHFIPPFKLI